MSKHEKKSDKKSPKKVIIISAVAAVAVIAAVVVVLFFTVFNQKELELPTTKQIVVDLQAEKSISEITVGKDTYTFKLTDTKVSEPALKPSEEEVEEADYTVSFSRESEIYAANSMTYDVVYKMEEGKLTFSTATTKDELSFKALKGADVEKATKKIQKKYKSAKYVESKTDLEKKDKLYFKVDDKEYEGTAVVVYTFDDKNGWVYKGINDKKVGFKKGITHKESGLYTNSNVKNILFLGIDSDSGAGRSDCMMLISVDSNTGKIKQTSFMRDNWFNIPGYGYNKLNAAYAFGGADLTVKTIQSTFGVKIDNYVAVSFTTFKQVINNLGGVTVNITADEAGYINWQIGKNGQAAIGYVPSSGGNVKLNGQQALWLCRDRGGNGYSGNDFTRTGRQRRVIQSLVTTYSNYTPSKVLSTINILKKSVKTDMTGEDFKWFAERSGKFFTYKFAERCVPTDGEWSAGTSSGGAWIISLNNPSGLISSVQKFIYEDIK